MIGISNWFSGLRAKLLVMVLIPIAVFAVTGFVALNALKSEVTTVEYLTTERLLMTEQIGEARSTMNAAGRYLWIALGNSKNPERRKKAIAEAKARVGLLRDAIEGWGKLQLDEELKGNQRSAVETFGKFEPIAQETIALLEAGRDAEAQEVILSRQNPEISKLADIMRDANTKIRAKNIQITKSSREDADRARGTLVISMLIASCAIFGIGVFVASSLARSLTSLTGSLGDSSGQVGSASQQLAAASQQLSAGATEGAASLEETVSSLEELSSIVKLNADHAKEAAELSQASTRAANEGETEIKKLIEAMAEISKGSKKIEEIITVIDDISFQTNLLALNAAVEAARAGEQGKGFAVVAEAVRSLAQRSSEAAKDISQLIKDAVVKTEHGASIADQSGAVLKNIVTSVKKVADLNGEIASASQQQSEGIAQISRAMNQLDTVMQQNAASAEEAAASSEELSTQGTVLQEMVKDLSTLVQGKGQEIEARAPTTVLPMKALKEAA